MSEPITIVGGGLAGLTLGIGLRQRDVAVTVWEAGRYPRHRVCGEFISGAGQRSLARLGLLKGLQNAGAGSAMTAAFYSGKAVVPSHQLPEAALCISRFVLDEWLARDFEKHGGELRSNERWRGEDAVGIVHANGRRAEAMVDGWRLFGLKVHARGVAMAADLELHFVPAGYVGLCKLPSGLVNVCGMFRRAATVPDLAQRWRDWLGGDTDSTLHSRLANAQFDDASFCSVAGFSLRPQKASISNECRVGDALTMIPPLTGNGMSMAFESAEVAIEPLAKFYRGAMTWNQAQQHIAKACDTTFTRRLRWARWLQRALFHPPTRSALLFFAEHSDWLWRRLVERTR